MTSESLELHARVTVDGKPVTGVSVTFSTNSRQLAVVTTDSDGVATALFSSKVPGRYRIEARFDPNERLAGASAAATMTLLQGRE
jgi:hypothetical protein